MTAQRIGAQLALWGGLLAAAVLAYGLHANWFLPALGLTTAYCGAQWLEGCSLWYGRAAYAAICGVLLLLIGGAGLFRMSTALAALPMLAMAVLALLGLRQSRRDQ